MSKDDKKNIFFTTTLPYVNGSGHIGHSLEFFQADAFVRKFKELGHNVYFNLGLDEHGEKIKEKAQSLNLEPQTYCDNQATLWKAFFEKLNIDYDNFYRTTSEQHKQKVYEIWTKLYDRGLLYKKEYSGKYCSGCLSFKLDKDLIKGLCPEHNIEPKIVSEENWFLKTEIFKETILKHIDTEEQFLYPKNKKEELKNQILSSEDWSVSRLKSSVDWAIEVPNDPNQTIYVWLEAVANYVIAAENTENFKWDKTTTFQICGPDNLRFQGHIFQTLLLALGHKNSDKLLVHGTVLDKEGKKMSKTVGNVVDPLQQIEKYGLEAVKYYTLCGLNTFDNSCWNEEDLVNLYNANLANNYGNLISRVLHLVELKQVVLVEPEKEFIEEVDQFFNLSELHWSNYDISAALRSVNDAVSCGNKYINDKAPWNSSNYQQELSNLHWLLIKGTNALKCVFPQKCGEALYALNVSRKKVNLFPRK